VYVFGNCDRLSPEAPVPVFTKVKKEYRDGMAGNVYQNISQILDVSIDFLTNDKNEIKKIRFVDQKSNQHLMRYDIEKLNSPFNKRNLPNKSYDAIIISDYDKGFIDRSLPQFIRKKYSCPVFVDSKKSDLSLYKGCTVKINENESQVAKNTNGVDVIITLGPNGAQRGKKIYKTDDVKVHDVCGAGDVFLASLVAGWLETKNMDEAIRIANRCATFSVTQMGTYCLTKQTYVELRDE
jgi:D-beta-D-heptose 7-phosphate kinase/D-beta-D-heptose 1-phosphate adenosyltransferase